MVETLRWLGPIRVGVEDTMPAAALLGFQKRLEGLYWVALGAELRHCRRVKDRVELAVLRRCSQLADAALGAVANALAPGVGGLELVYQADLAIRAGGGEGFSFDPSFGVGPHSTLVWAGVSSAPLAAGDVLVADLGALFRGYRSDLARTFIVPGKERPDVEAAIAAVRAAIDQVCKQIRPGARCSDLHAVAVEALAAYPAAMVTCLGHGVGLDVHEAPALCPNSTESLEAGMVLAIEPSVQVDQSVGVRWEVMVHVTEDGCERL